MNHYEDSLSSGFRHNLLQNDFTQRFGIQVFQIDIYEYMLYTEIRVEIAGNFSITYIIYIVSKLSHYLWLDLRICKYMYIGITNSLYFNIIY